MNSNTWLNFDATYNYMVLLVPKPLKMNYLGTHIIYTGIVKS